MRRFDLQRGAELPPVTNSLNEPITSTPDRRYVVGVRDGGLALHALDTRAEIAFWPLDRGVNGIAIHGDHFAGMADRSDDVRVLELVHP